MTVKQGWQRVVAEIEAANSRKGRARLGACSLEGTRLFERALRAGARIDVAVTTEAFCSDGNPRIAHLFAALAERGTSIWTVPDAVMQELTAGRSIGALVGLARLPEKRTLSELVTENQNAVFLACVGVDDPGNVGALVRTAHASGAAALLAVGASDAFHPKAVRTSMGSVFRLPVLERSSLAEAVQELRNAGVHMLGAVSSTGTPLSEVEHGEGAKAVFVGSEAFGLSDEDRESLDELVTIPMEEGVDSFSVNAAAAVLLYGLRRRYPRQP